MKTNIYANELTDWKFKRWGSQTYQSPADSTW